MKKIIKITDLKYTYPDGTRALKGINLELVPKLYDGAIPIDI